MKRILIISFSLLITAFVAEAQLLEDNQSRLKTAKVKSRGFPLFRGKKNTNSKRSNNVTRASSRRFTKASNPFGNKKVKPRYSNLSDRPVVNRKTTPRYSPGTPKFRNKGIARSSSAGAPFKASDHRVNPRYSSPRRFTKADYRIPQRTFSGQNPFRARDYKVKPRYSSGKPFSAREFKVSPRYSTGKPFTARDYRVNPRYSVGNPFRGMKFKVNPRYSPGSPFTARDYKVNPRYSQFKHRFYVNYRLKEQLRFTNPTAGYTGDYKLNRKLLGDQHPSSSYNFYKRLKSPGLQKVFRKWNVYWTRLNGNAQMPKGVKQSIKKPKFDRKEKDIWNN